MPKLKCPECGKEKIVVEARKKACPKCGSKMVLVGAKTKMPQVVITHADGGSTGSPQTDPKGKAPSGAKGKAPSGDLKPKADAAPEDTKE